MPKRSERVTWDGQPISSEPPFGATIVVYRPRGEAHEFLLLHRAHSDHEEEGDWAWTPPSGARYPGEDIIECAVRELKEETGLELELIAIEQGATDWHIYAASLLGDLSIQLSAEHDKYRWVQFEEALRMCRPEQVSSNIRVVADALGLI